jgi:alpha-ketoglutarate-dependent taurine dioxygenase
MPQLYDALHLFLDMLKRPEHGTKFLLTPGTVLILNNHRIMHGRTAFSPTSDRRLAGAYVNEEDWFSVLRRLVLEA